VRPPTKRGQICRAANLNRNVTRHETRRVNAATSNAPVNLLGLSRSGLVDFFASIGERRYRAEQVMKWIYHRGVLDFSGMTDLSKKVRDRLPEVAMLQLPELVSEQRSADGTRKWAVRVANGNCVETVLIPDRGRNTLCVSSQVGCVLDCSFCSTGKQGFNGNLSAAEIVGQVLLAARRLREDGDERGVTNVVLMGMGEPLFNFDAVVAATDLMMDDWAFGISKRRVTISTAGVVPAIYRLAEVTDVALAISLHAADDALRDVLVPINRKYPISQLMAACQHYLGGLGERRSVTIEYTLIAGINDRIEHAAALGRLLQELRCKINLIPFNPFPGTEYRAPEAATVHAFQTYLLNQGFATMLRSTRGDDIAAACGQLVGQVTDRTRRQERHLARIAAKEVA
jgi:23S rRNA (adenine2503-C2)-methyltransferase